MAQETAEQPEAVKEAKRLLALIASGPFPHAARWELTHAAEQLVRDLLDLLASQDRALEEAQRERDLAIAHDRQPYPTAWAYEQVCKARDKHQARAEQAEAARERLREALMELHMECLDEGHNDSGDPSAFCGRRGMGIRCGICMSLDNAKAALATPVRPTEDPQG